jgi:ABC-type multidrug transport system ATPase subunit
MIISTENLGKRFNREWIFQNLSRVFKPGDCIAITGPNGSGKSTLMHLLWAQTIPSKGKILYQVNGDIIAPEDAFEHLTIAAPYLDLIESYTLKEMLDFHFSYKKPLGGMTTSEMINRLDLGNTDTKRLEVFSSGMKQRVKLGLAFFSDVPVTFLDEPTTNLDEASVGWYHHHLQQLNQRLLFIATNTREDYPEFAQKLHLPDLK